MEFQIARVWAPEQSNLQRKDPVCPSLHFSLMGPKLYISQDQVHCLIRFLYRKTTVFEPKLKRFLPVSSYSVHLEVAGLGCALPDVKENLIANIPKM